MGKAKDCSHKVKDCRKNKDDLWVVYCKDCNVEFGSGFWMKKAAIKALDKK